MGNFRNEIKPIIEEIVKKVGKLNKAACKKALIKKFNDMEVAFFSDNAKIWEDEVLKQLKEGKYSHKSNPQQVNFLEVLE